MIAHEVQIAFEDSPYLDVGDPAWNDALGVMTDGNLTSGGINSSGHGGAYALWNMGSSVPIGDIQVWFDTSPHFMGGPDSVVSIYYGDDGSTWTFAGSMSTTGERDSFSFTAQYVQFITANALYETHVYDGGGVIIGDPGGSGAVARTTGKVIMF